MIGEGLTGYTDTQGECYYLYEEKLLIPQLYTLHPFVPRTRFI